MGIASKQAVQLFQKKNIGQFEDKFLTSYFPSSGITLGVVYKFMM